ncbi:hypothetical protein CH304_20125 [Rhodococcus sp. 15-649-1-2]|nr:hypothetical protein [Rhodococcus sp. 15-649-1-2]OZE79281.1 hypothetical protein CH304_20125 [Rhodococcus sp. 15-649-1-2]
MTNLPNGDLLALARQNAHRRLTGMARSAHSYTPAQLTLLQSLLDEFSRKSRANHPNSIRNNTQED